MMYIIRLGFSTHRLYRSADSPVFLSTVVVWPAAVGQKKDGEPCWSIATPVVALARRVETYGA